MNFYSQSVINYCERAGEGIFSEPINLFTNIFLVAASFFAFKLLKEQNLLQKKYVALSALIGLIGVGSGLWHSLRSPLTHALDFVPIYTFFILYLYILFNLLTKNRLVALSSTIMYILAQVLLSAYFPQLLNGSIRHIFNLGLVVGVLFWLKNKYQKVNYPLLTLFFTYATGVLFRSIDNVVCQSFPLGTHFVWHLAAAATCFYAIKSLVWITMNNNSLKFKTIL